MAPTRVAVVEEELADPKDIEVYKAIYENVILIGSGTYGSVYYVRQVHFIHCMRSLQLVYCIFILLWEAMGAGFYCLKKIL